MQTPVQRGVRLVAALEDLVGQEEASLQAGDFSAVAEIQLRTDALIVDLAAQANDTPTTSGMRMRLSAVQARREQTSAWLEGEIETTRKALTETDRSRRRVAQIAPVYGRVAAEPRSQLSAVS